MDYKITKAKIDKSKADHQSMSQKIDNKIIILSALEVDLLTTLVPRPQGVYGLEILELINQARTEMETRKLSIGSIYPTLGRMEKAGLIKGEFRESVAAKGSARRKYYTITPTGEIAITRAEACRRRDALD